MSAQSRTAVDSSMEGKAMESAKEVEETLPSLTMIVGKHIPGGSGDDDESESSLVESI